MKLPQDHWLVRESPHLRILPDDLAAAVRAKLNLAVQSFGRTATDRTKKAHRADLYPKVLIRPVCGGCGTPMILGRSLGKYQSFCCFTALHGIHGCTNRGYKSARIIDEAVLGTVMATLFTDDFLADLTADVNTRLAELARQPIPSTKKLEQEIANEDRQLKELQWAGRRPKVKSVKEKDVVAAPTQLRNLLQGDVSIAAQVLKALVGDVILETRQIEGRAKPQMVARFTINAIPAMAILGHRTGASEGNSVWPHLQGDHLVKAGQPSPGGEVIIPLADKRGGGQRRTEDDGQ